MDTIISVMYKMSPQMILFSWKVKGEVLLLYLTETPGLFWFFIISNGGFGKFEK